MKTCKPRKILMLYLSLSVVKDKAEILLQADESQIIRNELTVQVSKDFQM